jgi:hypothetical protein
VGVLGMHRTRYRGLDKLHLLHLLTATAMNLLRVLDWLSGKQRATARKSAFARLAAAQFDSPTASATQSLFLFTPFKSKSTDTYVHLWLTGDRSVNGKIQRRDTRTPAKNPEKQITSDTIYGVPFIEHWSRRHCEIIAIPSSSTSKLISE